MKTIIRVCRLSCISFLLLHQVCLAQFHGKLFTTHEERTYLDALRANFLKEREEPGFDITETGPPPLPEPEEDERPAAPVEYTLGGILARSDGSRTVWLNNQPVAEADLPSNMKLIADGTQVVLRVGTGANFLLLKPGQTVNMANGEILESYQRVPAVNARTTADPAAAADAAAATSQLQAAEAPQITPESAAPEASTNETGDP